MYFKAKKHYFEMVPSNYMDDTVIDFNNCDVTKQQELLKETVLNEVFLNHSPSLKYRVSFLKRIISQLEDAGQEVCDAMYDLYVQLLSQKQEVDTCYKTYFINEEMSVTVQESVDLISKGTTGMCTWQAAKFLAEWAVEHTDIFQKRCVMELGSGVGLTGLIIVICCVPELFIFTDVHQQVLQLLESNVQLLDERERMKKMGNEKSGDSCGCPGDQAPGNHVRSPRSYTQPDVFGDFEHINSDVQVLSLDWENVSTDQLKQLAVKVDIVIAADVVYDTHILPSLTRVLRILLLEGVSAAYISSTIRNPDTNKAFLNALDDAGLHYVEIEAPRSRLFQYECTSISLICITAPGKDHIK